MINSDEKYLSKIIPTKFSVDLLTTVTDKKSVVTDDESTLCLNNNNLKHSPEIIDIINSVQPVSTTASEATHISSMSVFVNDM